MHIPQILPVFRTFICFTLLLTCPVSLAEYRLAIVGDSLMAGYGLEADEGFIPQLDQALTKQGLDVSLLNMAVSGNTVADGLSRIDYIVESKPDGVILCLGANDMLRAIDPQITEQNLITILTKLQRANVDVLIAGMRASLNWGPVYKNKFDAIYPKLAKEYSLMLYPFFLEDVARVASLNLADGLHPNPAGIARIVKNILPQTIEFIETNSN